MGFRFWVERRGVIRLNYTSLLPNLLITTTLKAICDG
jgi:hypothetical protein